MLSVCEILKSAIFKVPHFSVIDFVELLSDCELSVRIIRAVSNAASPAGIVPSSKLFVLNCGWNIIFLNLTNPMSSLE